VQGERHQEIEIKLQVADVDRMRQKLRGLGFALIVERGLEQNRIYDTPQGELRQKGELIRLREFDGRSVLTYKGPATVGRHKEREEIEVAVGTTESMALILARLGLEPRFRYEKYRSEWQQAGQEGIAMLDETPVGDYLELEGPGDWIDRTAEQLGYHTEEYVNLSYARLFAAQCAAAGLPEGDMVFPREPVLRD
jgi:adenylate cyclase, class 2